MSDFITRRAVPMVLLGLSLAPTMAHAVVRCIENGTQFQSTMDAALASANAVEEVRIKQGNYVFTTGASGYFGVAQGTGKALSIRGGWSGPAGQCTTQDGDAIATLLNGNGQRPILAIHAATTFTGSIVVENLLFAGGYATTNTGHAALSLTEQNGGSMSILVDRVWIEGNRNQPGFSPSVLSLTSNAGIVLRNSVVAGNDVGIGTPAVVIFQGGQNNLILNNTFARNISTNSSGHVGLFVSHSNGATSLLANNLFDLNASSVTPKFDIRLNTAGASLQNNRFTGLSGTATSQSGSTTGPAGFISGGYELAVTSTARDAGAFFVPSTQGTLDPLAHLRIQGPAVDLGALEFSTVFANGFE